LRWATERKSLIDPSWTVFVESGSFTTRSKPEQLEYAGREVTIANVGIYHGGDVIYQLVEAPGVWHEDCLVRRAAEP
jgi:hypothetical protein